MARMKAPPSHAAAAPPIAGVIGLSAALDYLCSLDAQAVRRHEQALLEHLVAGLSVREGVRLLGGPQAALASFVVDDVHHADLAQLLFEHTDELIAVHPAANETTVVFTMESTPIPLHPGAIRYFEEAGHEVPDRLRP